MIILTGAFKHNVFEVLSRPEGEFRQSAFKVHTATNLGHEKRPCRESTVNIWRSSFDLKRLSSSKRLLKGSISGESFVKHTSDDPN